MTIINRNTAALPTGYFMVHKNGDDVGFSWDQHDPIFGPAWERVPINPQRDRMLHHLLLDALRWAPRDGQVAKVLRQALDMLEVAL